jgi:hypothetical protein
MRALHYLTWLIIGSVITSCPVSNTETNSVPEENYTFQAVPDSEAVRQIPMGGLQVPSLARVTELSNSGRWAEYMAAFRGSLLQLFGEPLYTSDLLDEAYTYIIEATDQQGSKWFLMAVQAGGGPTILGDFRDLSVIPVAEALLRLIETTKPADFEAVIYDDDTDNTVTYGCQAGVCYWHEAPGTGASP